MQSLDEGLDHRERRSVAGRIRSVDAAAASAVDIRFELAKGRTRRCPVLNDMRAALEFFEEIEPTDLTRSGET